MCSVGGRGTTWRARREGRGGEEGGTGVWGGRGQRRRAGCGGVWSQGGMHGGDSHKKSTVTQNVQSHTTCHAVTLTAIIFFPYLPRHVIQNTAYLRQWPASCHTGTGLEVFRAGQHLQQQVGGGAGKGSATLTKV